MARNVSLRAPMSSPPDPTDSLLEVTRHGLFVPAAKLYLDARWAPGSVFVSHAHADHCSRAERIVCTPETAALHSARRGPRDAFGVSYDTPTRGGGAGGGLRSGGPRLGGA